ncbi:MAG: PDZ domain-containing protein, partial [Myxococcales bacterium]
EGALVSSVSMDSPAARAGLEAGDVILSLNGHDIEGSSDLPPRVAALKPGTPARLEVFRDHQKRAIEVRIGEAKGATAAASQEEDEHGDKLGLSVRPLTPEEQKEAGVKNGMVVENARGPAAEAGIQPGDVILAVNGKKVADVEQLRKLVASSGKHVALLVERGNAQIFVPVDLG